MIDRARVTLSDAFGFSEFRNGQEAVIGRLLSCKSVVAIFPTGAGKSLCYQLPALMLDGLTIVVSPLIALMKDQIDFLTQRGIAAARLDSSLTACEVRQTFHSLVNRRLRLLYVAPERLANERFLTTLSRVKIAMLAVDEAHCISEWGHNFRPDYLKLAALARDLGVGRVLALTATATPEVAADIARSFHIDADDIVQTGFHRPNLHLSITPCVATQRPVLLVSRLKERPPGPAIVYVTLQRTAEEIAALLVANGLPARHYHAGLDPETRNAVQDWFMSSEIGIVVATIAFGMGIDKADIRSVYHFNMPKGLESYSQEIGRAGRDGSPSTCEVFACADDVITLENFSFGDTPTCESLAAFVAEVLSGKDERVALSPYDLSGRHDIRPLVVDTVLTYLELDGALKSTGPFYVEYKLQYLVDRQSIDGHLPAHRRSQIGAMLDLAVAGRTWFKLDLHGASEALGESREQLVSDLAWLEEHGFVTLQTSGLRLGYRRSRRPVDHAALVEQLDARFADRERRDIARLGLVVSLTQEPGCITRRLLAYFGEMQGDCGHCGWCDGTGRVRQDLTPDDSGEVDSPRSQARAPTPNELDVVAELVAEGHKALATPRQMARFLCGLTSPATTRARLTRESRFGVLDRLRFTDVLSLAQHLKALSC